MIANRLMKNVMCPLISKPVLVDYQWQTYEAPCMGESCISCYSEIQPKGNERKMRKIYFCSYFDMQIGEAE